MHKLVKQKLLKHSMLERLINNYFETSGDFKRET
jgi:hypothetical protein